MENLASALQEEFLFQLLANHWVMTLVLVALVGLFVRAARKLNATTRHNIWLVTLISFLLMPLLVFAPRPDLEVPKIDSSIFQQAQQIENLPVTEHQPVITDSRNSVTAVEPATVSTHSNSWEVAYPEPSSEAQLIDPSASAPALSLSILLKTLFVVWLTGVAFLLRRLWLEYRAARELELQSDSVTPYFQRRFEQLCVRLGVEEVPPLRFHAGINAPMTVGLYRVWVAIPMMWREHIDDDVFDQTLTHELGHIARKDPLVNTLQRYLEIALWMYPAVWYVSRQLELERESACDDWVLTHDGKGSNYASNLLDVAESLYLQPKVLAVGCLRSHSQLSRRIQNLLDKSSDHAIRNSGKLLSAVAAGLVVTLSASAVIWPDANEYLASLEAEQSEISETTDGKAGEIASLSLAEISEAHTAGIKIRGLDVETTKDGEGIKIDGEELNFPKSGGTLVINGVEITKGENGDFHFGPATPEPPEAPERPVTFGTYAHSTSPDTVINLGNGGPAYNTRTVENTDDGSFSYAVSTKDGRYGAGKFEIKRKKGKVTEVEVEPAIDKRDDPLLYAAWNHDWTLLKRQIKDGKDVNAFHKRPTMPRTALNAAILQRNLEMVEYLVEKGADLRADTPHADYSDRVTNALTTAAIVGDKRIAKYLIKKGAPAGDATMVTAIQGGDVDFVRFLNSSGVRFDESSLVIATQNRNKDMVKYLLENDDCGCMDEDTALIVAIQNRDTKMAKLLLDEGADADDGALMMAIQNRDTKMVDWLLDAGADVDDGALVIAIQNRDTALAKRLIKAGADPDDGALVIAIQNRDMEMVNWLLEAGADPDDGALVMAVQNRDKNLAKRLLKAGADADDGALVIALQNRDKEMVKWLIDAGADVDDGAMIIAIQSRDDELINLIRKEYDKEYRGDTELTDRKIEELQAKITHGSETFGEGIKTFGAVANGVLDIIGDATDYEALEYEGLALTKAMEQENISLAKSLMADGIRPNTLHLLKALEQEETDLACEMLDKGARPDSISLLKALEMEDLDLARKFMDHGAQPNGLTLLKATEIGDQSFIDLVRAKQKNRSYKKSYTKSYNNAPATSNKTVYGLESQKAVDAVFLSSLNVHNPRLCPHDHMLGDIRLTEFSFDDWPVKSRKITLGFDENAGHFKDRNYSPHTGIDLAAKKGTEIRSIADGVVVKSKFHEGFGNVVMIDHGNGFTSEYASNKKNLVSKGQRVSKGQLIALVGDSAKNATGPHLHFELNYHDHEVNPALFLKENKEEREKILSAGS